MGSKAQIGSTGNRSILYRLVIQCQSGYELWDLVQASYLKPKQLFILAAKGSEYKRAPDTRGKDTMERVDLSECMGKQMDMGHRCWEFQENAQF